MEYLPSGHTLIEPLIQMCPALHVRHCDEATPEYVPGGHGCFRPSWQNIPAGQSSQAEAPTAENFPIGQVFSWPYMQ